MAISILSSTIHGLVVSGSAHDVGKFFNNLHTINKMLHTNIITLPVTVHFQLSCTSLTFVFPCVNFAIFATLNFVLNKHSDTCNYLPPYKLDVLMIVEYRFSCEMEAHIEVTISKRHFNVCVPMSIFFFFFFFLRFIQKFKIAGKTIFGESRQ